MNCLSGYIEGLSGTGNLTLVKVNIGGTVFNSIVIGNTENSAYLATGKSVNLLFDESEVMIGKNISGKLSIGNVANCRVISIEKGNVFTRLGLDLHGNTVYSLITCEAQKELNIAVHDKVEMYVKMNEIFLQYP